MAEIFDRREEIPLDGRDADIGRLATRLRSAGWRVAQGDGDRIDAVHGSRFTFRMFGCYTQIGRRNLPARLEIRREGAASALLSVRLYSDEGWYLFYVSEVTTAYEELLHKTLETVRDA
ncbi:hypothetical protein O4J56_15855 [Nocardiopsis sp. RSe5-2]|uniref:Uncharacterized protein n=1 Tax=Nocardiopsis endophytica TaxID=3018445 RepID=A0ABT4U6M2_9ACTN|nr:hypothetical protein [Nocardiopsis endophytica]MDA2812119.1 hypothetical protein [Nocardiopsis endophytica]